MQNNNPKKVMSQKKKEILKFLRIELSLVNKKRQKMSFMYFVFSLLAFLTNIVVVALASVIICKVFSDQADKKISNKILPGVLAVIIVFLFFYNLYITIKGSNTKYGQYKTLYTEIEFLYYKMKFSKKYNLEDFHLDWEQVIKFYKDNTIKKDLTNRLKKIMKGDHVE